MDYLHCSWIAKVILYTRT